MLHLKPRACFVQQPIDLGHLDQLDFPLRPLWDQQAQDGLRALRRFFVFFPLSMSGDILTWIGFS